MVNLFQRSLPKSDEEVSLVNVISFFLDPPTKKG
jgi:hypothetical protein